MTVVRHAVPQKLRSAIMRYFNVRKIEVRGPEGRQHVWGWGDLLDPLNIAEENWRLLGPLGHVTKIASRHLHTSLEDQI